MTAVKPSDAGAAVLRRKRDLAAIHAMRKELSLAEEDYRARVALVSGGRTDSAGELTARERVTLIEGLKALGAGGAKRPSGGRSRPARTALTPMQRKVRAQWIALRDAGAIADASEAALAAWVKRQFGVEALQWLDNATAPRAIEQLKRWLDRVCGQKEGT